MVISKTVNASVMRSINFSTILELIRRESPISRSKIAERLGMSLPTVMRIIDELVEEKLVVDANGTEWSGGRRRTLLKFNESGYVVIGIDLGGTKMYGAVSDLGGKVYHEVHIERHGTTEDDSYRWLVELIEDLIELSRRDGHEIRGIGVGAPGITRSREGIVRWAPSLNWREFPLKARLTDHFGLPVVVDNDVNLAALGEWWFGSGHAVNNMVLIAIGTGIGAGIILDGALYRGTNEAAGEIGYLLPGRQYLGRRYDQFGAFEGLASGTGIAERAAALLPADHPLAQRELSAEDVFAAQRDGEAWAKQVVDETVDYLALGIATVSALFDPELIVLGGGVSGASDVLLQPILDRIDGAIPLAPNLQVSTLGRRAVVMGTITSVLHLTTDYYVLRRLI